MATKLIPELDTRDAQVKMMRARTLLICGHPFFASILLRLKQIEGYVVHLPKTDLVFEGPCPCPPGVVWPECPHSMATDGRRLLWNPKFVDTLTSAETQGVLCHEVIHVAGLHPLRRGTREPRAWNHACDQATNHIVVQAKLRLPAGVIPGVSGKSAEELYALLDPATGGSGTTNVSGGKPTKSGKGAPNNPNAAGTSDRMVGDVFDPTNANGSALSEGQREALEQETKIFVQQAVNAAKAAGQLPAGVARMVEEALEPRIPWKEILARFVDSSQRCDYSWLRPNRRYTEAGLIIPSLWSPGFGRIIMGCDTSGSVTKEQLKDICSELIGCLEAYMERGQAPEIDVAWFDTVVYPQRITDPEDLDPKGKGGTSYAPVFDWIREDGIEGRAVVMITDGCCETFGEPPDCPVLWILTRPNSSFVPPFGEITCVINN